MEIPMKFILPFLIGANFAIIVMVLAEMAK